MRSEAKRERDREHAKATYWRDIEASRVAMRAKTAAVRVRRLPLIDKIKMERGCVDCGFNVHPAALHFDHVDPKTKLFTIAKGLTRSWENILIEIAKCEVRCANCHAIRGVREQHLGRPRIDKDMTT